MSSEDLVAQELELRGEVQRRAAAAAAADPAWEADKWAFGQANLKFPYGPPWVVR
jgi:hypothetical protein